MGQWPSPRVLSASGGSLSSPRMRDESVFGVGPRTEGHSESKASTERIEPSMDAQFTFELRLGPLRAALPGRVRRPPIPGTQWNIMRGVLAGALACAMTAGCAVAWSQTAESVLDANQAALGDAPTKGVVRLQYSYRASGLTGTQTRTFDVATGAYRDAEESDDIRFADGYDGKVPWQQDISGTYTPQEGGDRIPVAVN